MGPAMHKSANVALCGVYDVLSERAQVLANRYDVAAYTSYDEVLEDSDIDAVYISTPTVYHKELCILAAKAGKHVLCEKSLAMDPSEAQEIAAACRKSGVAIMEGFMYRHHTQHSFVQNMVKQGEIGEPWLFSAWFGFPSFPPSDFRMNKAMGGGALLDAGAYVINAARFSFRSEPASSHAYLQLNKDGLDMRGTAILDFGGGRTAEVAFGMNNSYKNSYSIWGTKGEITLLRAFSIPAWEQPVAVIKNQGLKREYILPACDHFAEELKGFATLIQEQKYDYDEPILQAKALDLLRVGEKCDKRPHHD